MKKKNPVTVRKLTGGGYRVTDNGKVKNPAWLIPGLRAARAAGKPKCKNPVSVHSPSRGIEIYGRLLRIEAQKGPGHVCDAKCKAAGHRYYHDFSKHAHVYGMPDGSLKIVDRT